MTAATEAHGPNGDSAVIVSGDTHVGPRVREDLRPYCPPQYRSEYDDYVAQHQAYLAAVLEAVPVGDQSEQLSEVDGKLVRGGRNRRTAGHYDITARLRDLNYDGIAAEVIFHGSRNDELVPFTPVGDPAEGLVNKTRHVPEDLALAAVGRHIFNCWLADFCSVEPERHVGLAQIPIWDVEATVEEIEWAKAAGLRGINFPAPQTWWPEYNHPQWEPVWSAAEALELPLVTHSMPGGQADYTGPGGQALKTLESPHFFTRRAVPWMVLGGVFERHPGLKLVLTESPGLWWEEFMSSMDSVARYRRDSVAELRRLPSEYCRESLFVCASFMSRGEAADACEHGYFTNMLWGSDYPHPEGTFRYPDDWDETPLTHLSLRSAFAECGPDQTRAMLSDNAARVYGLDLDALGAVAARIGAPTLEQLREPLDAPPAGITSLGFRQHGAFD